MVASCAGDNSVLMAAEWRSCTLTRSRDVGEKYGERKERAEAGRRGGGETRNGRRKEGKEEWREALAADGKKKPSRSCGVE